MGASRQVDSFSPQKRTGDPQTSPRPTKKSRQGSNYNPLRLKPLGHLFAHPEDGQTRLQGLGRLAALPDELLLSHIFSNLDARTLLHCSRPVILTGLMQSWPAMEPGTRRWTLRDLAKRFPWTLLRAEATLTTLPDYVAYHDDCSQDESPLYLFESDFVQKTFGDKGEPSLGDDYEVPACFKQDFFEVMGDMRPNYRWLIAGPKRSGSTWHQDPNGTSAWNAVTVGRKAWVMFPNDCLPPGVHVSDDMGHVEAPLSLAEWFHGYYKEAKAKFGPSSRNPATRGKMREGICEQGEIMFVPSGWWHIVVNLEPAIAVTQNFVSCRELPNVLKFMKYRPEQVSGFKIPGLACAEEGGLDEADEALPGVFDLFVKALYEREPEIARPSLARLQEMENQHNIVKPTVVKERGLWSKVKRDAQLQEETGNSFSFGFELGDDDHEEDSVLE
ncbi:hypothetical protein OIV83_006179 [Microbotryomycetes sp. JL201]|nr:hypothetical protein OIV83_006179 [Microbotryomycetes sp. JL201]